MDLGKDYRLGCLCAHRSTLQPRGGNGERDSRKFLTKVMVEIVRRKQRDQEGEKMPCVTWEQPVGGLGVHRRMKLQKGRQGPEHTRP